MTASTLLAFALQLCFSVISVILLYTDFRRRKIPNKLLGVSYLLSFVLLLGCAVITNTALQLATAICIALLAFLLAVAVFLLLPSAVGAGDVKLLPLPVLLIVYLWGAQFLAEYLVATAALTAITICCYSCLLRCQRRRRSRTKIEIPFGPVLLGAYWVVAALQWFG